MSIYLKSKRVLSTRYRVIRSNIILNKDSGNKMIFSKDIALIPKSNWENEFIQQLLEVKAHTNFPTQDVETLNTNRWWEN